MSKYLSKSAILISVLLFNLLAIGNAHAIGKIYLDQLGLDAQEVKVKMNIFRTGGSVTLNGCDEDSCPSGLSVNKKTDFMVHGKKIKRQDVKDYSGKRAYIKFFKASRSVILIDWK
ncbi:MAG: hypothetical protein OQK78_04425 [Gammaproteobacteria bacterium]|nr:hypothetical protein [Gammaproteobacteria bacterium]